MNSLEAGLGLPKIQELAKLYLPKKIKVYRRGLRREIRWVN